MAFNNLVTLSPNQVEELNGHLANMRHEINNNLSLMVAALELIRLKPEMRERMLGTISDQPPKIMAQVQQFSVEFEKAMRIVREEKKGFERL